MRTGQRNLRLAETLLCAALLASCARATAGGDPSVASIRSSEATALILINRLRGENGRTPLTLDPRVTKAAMRHARAMAEQDFFGHVGPDGSQIGERLTRAGYIWGLVAENIAAGMTTARDAVRTWQDSPRHRHNMLLEGARHAGIAHLRREPDPGSVTFGDYWVLVLAAPQPQDGREQNR